jgi:hypothetical protein
MALSDELLGHWIQARRESSTDMVFRPAGWPLPLSRGGMAFEFRANGTFVEVSSGPTDRSQGAAGQWSLRDDALRLSYSDDRPDEIFKVATSKDKLVLSKT